MKTKSNIVPDSESYKNLVDLMAVFAEASNRMSVLETTLQEEWIELVDERRAEYSALQHTIAEAEEQIESIVTLNPQWFEKAKTLKTPYGTAGFRRSSKLAVKNEEATIILIEQLGPEAVSQFIREKRELNLEALEKLEDAELKKFRITRETSESCTVKPAKVDLGKAVKSAAEKVS